MKFLTTQNNCYWPHNLVLSFNKKNYNWFWSLCASTLSKTTLSITTLSITAFSIKGLHVTLSVTMLYHSTLNIIMLGVAFDLVLCWVSFCWVLWRHCDDTQHVTLSINYTHNFNVLPLCWVSLCWVSRFIFWFAECRNIEFCYAKCRYAECCGAVVTTFSMLHSA